MSSDIISIDKVKVPPISSEFYHEKYHDNRLAKVILFYKFLCLHEKFANLTDNKKKEIIKNLEKSCYSFTLEKAKNTKIPCKWNDDDFTNLYHDICGRVIGYLSIHDNNFNDANKFINNLIDNPEYSKKFPRLSHKNLYPEEYLTLEERNMADKQITVKTSKLRTCPKCKRKSSITKNRYNRSLDEGVNLTAICLWCNYEWCC